MSMIYYQIFKSLCTCCFQNCHSYAFIHFVAQWFMVLIFKFLKPNNCFINFELLLKIITNKNTTMASQHPTKQFPLQCPLPWCGKGFNDVPQIQKHLSMSAWCGLYLQKLLHAPSMIFGKPSLTTGAPQTTTNINHSFAAMDVCFPVSHPEPDYLVANKDDKIIDKPNPMNWHLKQPSYWREWCVLMLVNVLDVVIVVDKCVLLLVNVLVVVIETKPC